MPRAYPGLPEPLGVTLDPRRRQRRRLLGARDGDRALPVRRVGARQSSRASGSPSAPATCSTASSPASARAHRYGLRAHGPYDPRTATASTRPSSSSIPYARRWTGPFSSHPSAASATAGRTCGDDGDSAPFVPKAIVLPPDAPEPAMRRRACRGPDACVYELHVRGFTRLHPEMPAALRGTCAGWRHPAAVAHLARLGVTTVELMPHRAAIDERHLAPLGLANYWGYNPVALCAPTRGSRRAAWPSCAAAWPRCTTRASRFFSTSC